MHPFYLVRALGGMLFVIGALVMAYNVYRTWRGDQREEQPYEAAPTARPATA